MANDNNQNDPTFTESLGSEANQHAKKLAQSKSKKKAKKYDAVYSQKGMKVVKITVKPNGIYNEYVGSMAKTRSGEAATLKNEIIKWKKENIWIEQHALKEYATKKLALLNK